MLGGDSLSIPHRGGCCVNDPSTRPAGREDRQAGNAGSMGDATESTRSRAWAEASQDCRAEGGGGGGPERGGLGELAIDSRRYCQYVEAAVVAWSSRRSNGSEVLYM